jgi:5'-3' exonuclease
MSKLMLIDGNNVFRRLFEKLGTSALQTLYAESISSDPTLTIAWVWDGRNSKARRQAIFPDYKAGRKPASDEFYETRKFFKELTKHSSCLTIECDGWEADDVIATLARGWEGTVFIHSNDADFFVLASDNVILERDAKEFPASAEDMRLFKALCGDTSDSILGIKGFGGKKFEKLTPEQKVLLTDCMKGNFEAVIAAAACKFTPAVNKYFLENIEDIRKGWKIIDLYTVPDAELSAGMVSGQLNPDAANAMMERIYMAPQLPGDAEIVAAKIASAVSQH